MKIFIVSQNGPYPVKEILYTYILYTYIECTKMSEFLNISENKHFQKKVSYKNCKVLNGTLNSNISVIALLRSL